jgi:cell division septum initiation protein DivIVA
MAVQFSRPDPSSPTAIAAATFSTARKGFDQNEVRTLLRTVSGEVSRLQDRERQLERELAALKRAQVAPSLPMDDEALTALLGEETARVISTAREAAASIRSRAEEGAARLLREASEEAAQTRSQSELDAAKRLQEAHLEVQTHLEHARAQGRDMANEAREYRERVLADVGRRRELARMQLQQVISGRDRLLQAFERARLVAVDVLVEVDELGGEPDELVNLALTTGPVPVMVPRPSVPSSTLPKLAPPAAEPQRRAKVVAQPPAMAAAAAMTMKIVEPEAAVQAQPVAAAPADAGPYDYEEDRGEPAELMAEPPVDWVPATAEPALAPEAQGSPEAEQAAAAAEEHQPLEADQAPEAEAEQQLAPVVSLFAGELETVVVERTESHQRVAVDELFAKLKIASAESVAKSVEASAASAARRAAVAPAGDHAEHDEEPAGVSAFEHRDEALSPINAAVARKLKRVLADEQNGVLDILRRKEPVTELEALVSLEPDHSRMYAQAVYDELAVAAAGGADLSQPGVDAKRRIADTGVMETLAAEVGEAVVQPLRDRLASVIDGSSTNEDIAQHVRGIYREWKMSVLDGAASDLAASAYARGSAALLIPGTAVRWVVSPGTAVCDECALNERAGIVSFGDAFPTGDHSAPVHLGCRCLVVADRH